MIPTVILAIVGAIYLRGWLRLRSVPAWRACSFFFGLFGVWIAIASPVSSLDGRMLTAHMIQHLLLMTIAPPLIWLGEPLIVANMRASGAGWPVGQALALWRASVPRFPALLGHPVFCWLAAAAALVVWHVPALFRLGMQSHAWHWIEHASFFITGLLFWWPVVQPWPAAAHWPRWSMLLYLFLATLPCDVLSGLLVFSDRVAYPMYEHMTHGSGLSALEDQQCAAALMWTCVTVVFLVAGTVLSIQLLSPRKEVLAV